MLDNSTQKMVLTSPSTHHWPQNHHIDEKMEKSQQLQPPPPPPSQQSLKCPRCDSSNTKFCYYNNYSLSQPRHFCKACKRYWTRGGTLRNVPVGGGCRKNKRVKRANSSSSASAAVEGGSINPNSNPNPNYSSGSQIDSTSSAPNHHHNHHHQINPLFYGLGSSEMNLGFPGRFNSGGGFDLNPQLNAIALEFSSAGKQIQDSSCMLSNYSIFGSSLLHQTKLISNDDSNFHRTATSAAAALSPFEELHLNNGNNTSVKQVKVELQEQQQSMFDWNNINQNNNVENQIEQIGYSSLDPSLYWNPNTTTSVGSLWHDPSNLGSSLTSLI